VSKHEEVSTCIAMLVELIDDEAELDDVCALLCAVGAACGDERIAVKLLEAITPIMIAAFADAIGRNN
jgi:Cdc6-like AAA superfamily ATPase